MRRFLVLARILLVIPVMACNIPYFQLEQSKQGAAPLINPDTLEKIDLALLLHPKPSASTNGDSRERLQKAFNEFYKSGDPSLHRDRVQERIIAASNQRCANYKQFVRRFDTTTNLLLGGLTTLTAGLGAIFTHMDTVRALSGAASITSGFRAEVNEAYFHQQTVQLITDGLEARRKELYSEMVKQRSKDIRAYTVENAVADAILYHDACSLLAGLEQVALNQRRAEDPGVNQLNKHLDLLTTMKKKMREFQEVLQTQEGTMPGVVEMNRLQLLSKAFQETKEKGKEIREAIKDLGNVESRTVAAMRGIPTEGRGTNWELAMHELAKRENGTDSVIVASMKGLLVEVENVTTVEKQEQLEKCRTVILERLASLDAAKTVNERQVARAELNLQMAAVDVERAKLVGLLATLNNAIDKTKKVLGEVEAYRKSS